ncbi:MAG: XRE family transcriptional regulator [Alphaproteobacteria bacterium]|nr:XRE family transcriptional regulator [Alphaproteobacteria bacterium]
MVRTVRTHKEVLAKLTPQQRDAVKRRARELEQEEMSLRQLRKAHTLTQVRLAEALGTTQESISRIEHNSDLLLSTLRSYIEAMGGQLQLVAQFPDKPPISISGIGALGDLPPRVRRGGASTSSQ